MSWQKINLHLILGVSVTFLLVGCIDEKVAGGTTETGNTGKEGKIAGFIVDEDDNGVNDVSIEIVKVNNNPYANSMVDSLTTDSEGYFISDSLPDNTYNVIASQGDKKVLLDSNEVTGTQHTDLGISELQPTGSISGVIRLQPHHDSRTVFIIVLGTSYLTVPLDSMGNFEIAGMAAGTYHVRLLTTLDDYLPKDTVLKFSSGEAAQIEDTLTLEFTGIPVVTGYTLDYDTLRQIVNLSWDKGDADLVKGYNIYRKDSTTDFIKINATLIIGTNYSDDSVLQDESYEYKITAVNPDDNQGDKGKGILVTTSSAFSVSKTGIRADSEFYSMALFDNEIYTVTLEGRVQVFNQDEQLVKSWNTVTPLEELFVFNAIQWLSTDSILILEKYNVMRIYNSSGSSFFSFEVPFSVRGFTVIEGVIYFSGNAPEQIVSYSLEGDSLFTWTERGFDTEEYGILLELVSMTDNLFLLESNNYPPQGPSWHVIKYDRDGNYTSNLQLDYEGHPHIHMSEFNDKLYISTDKVGYIFDSGFNLLAKFNLFETQTGILPLSDSSFLVGAENGSFFKFELK